MVSSSHVQRRRDRAWGRTRFWAALLAIVEFLVAGWLVVGNRCEMNHTNKQTWLETWQAVTPSGSFLPTKRTAFESTRASRDLVQLSGLFYWMLCHILRRCPYLSAVHNFLTEPSTPVVTRSSTNVQTSFATRSWSLPASITAHRVPRIVSLHISSPIRRKFSLTLFCISSFS